MFAARGAVVPCHYREDDVGVENFRLQNYYNTLCYASFLTKICLTRAMGKCLFVSVKLFDECFFVLQHCQTYLSALYNETKTPS